MGRNAIIYPNVEIQEGVVIDDQAVIGKPPHRGRNQMELDRDGQKTVVGEETYVGTQSIIYEGADIGAHNYLADKSFIREDVQTEEDVVIGTNVIVSYNAQISSGVKIMTGSNIGGNMKIGEDSFIGVQVTSFNDNSPTEDDDRDAMSAANIGKRVMIGSNATLFPEISIGSDVTVGAGAVVTKTIRETIGIYMGVPAELVD